MLPLKTNQKSSSGDTICERCNLGEDNEYHLLHECPTMQDNTVSLDEVLEGNVSKEKLPELSQTLQKIFPA